MREPIKDTFERNITVAAVMSVHPKHPDKWNVSYCGEPLVTAVRDPEHAACRELLKRGITGRVTFVHGKTGTPGLSMDIEKGAGLSTNESTRDGAPRTRKFKPFSMEG